jgi:uncharacterized protein YxeA
MKLKVIVLFALVLLVVSALYLYGTRGYQSETLRDTGTIEEVATSQNSEEEDDQGTYIYETEAYSKEDCSSYEHFDAQRHVCSFECTTEKECAEIEKSIDDELSGWLDEDTSNKDFKESHDDVEKTLVSQYVVQPGEKITLEKGAAGSDDAAIWHHVAAISPDAMSDAYIENFMIFNDPQNDTLAFVDDDDMNGKWRVGVNLAGYKDSTVRERNLTIVHELGHIVTLNNAQVKNVAESSCSSYFTTEGCAGAGSYLNSFVNAFWTPGEIQKALDGGDVYAQNKFVTEYAASGPEEDIAESFAYFVLDGKDEGGQIKDKKSAFFYNYPELLHTRESMRKGVYSDVLRARRSTQR